MAVQLGRAAGWQEEPPLWPSPSPELAPWLALVFLASVPLPMWVGRGQGSWHALLLLLEGPCHPWANTRPASWGRAMQRAAAPHRPSSLPGYTPSPGRGLLLTSCLRSSHHLDLWGHLLGSLPELGSPSGAPGALHVSPSCHKIRVLVACRVQGLCPPAPLHAAWCQQAALCRMCRVSQWWHSVVARPPPGLGLPSLPLLGPRLPECSCRARRWAGHEALAVISSEQERWEAPKE